MLTGHGSKTARSILQKVFFSELQLRLLIENFIFVIKMAFVLK